MERFKFSAQTNQHLKIYKMKQIQIILLLLFCAFTGFNAAGQANANLNILTLNSGQVSQGAVVDLQVSVGNTGPNSSIGVNKVRAQISIPIAIATALPTAQQTGLPAGWIVLTNTGSAITVCNGTDVIPVGEQRQIFIKIQGTAVGGPSTINGSLSFGPGSGVCTGPGSLSGDNTADNTSTSSITVLPAAACNLSVSALAGTISCNGGTTTVTATATGAAGAVEYSLNGGTFQISNTFTVNAAGSPYTVTARESGNTSCTATASAVTVTEPAAIIASASAGTINCFGGTTTLTVTGSGGTAPLQYSLDGLAYQAGNTFTVSATGSSYIVSVKDANQCTATTNTVTVSQPTQLTATAIATAVSSIGGSDGTATAVPVGGTSPYSYSWAPGGQTTVTASGLTAGSYTVTITDSKGCTTTASATVGSPACNVTASASAGPAILCNAGTTSLTVTAAGAAVPVQYSLNGGTFQSGNVFTVGAGTYTVTVKDANNCTAATSAVTITQPTAVVVSGGAQPIGLPGGTTTVTINATGGTAPYTGTGSFVRSAGTYTFTVTDANGCTGSTTLTLSDPVAGNANASLNILTLNSGQVNQGAVVDLQVSVGNTGPSFIGVNKVRAQISIPIAIATALPNAQQTGLPAGWIILTNTGGAITICNGTDQIPSGQQRQLFIKIQGTTAGGPSTINGSLSFGPGSGVCTGPGSLPGDNTADNTSTSSITVISTCSLGVTASAGAIACNGGTTTLTATAAGANGNVEYSLNAGAYQSGNTFIVNAAGAPYTVTARETGNTSCTATSAPVSVADPAALVVFASAGNIACNGGTTILTVTATGGTGALQYSLNGGTFQSGNTFTVNATGSPYTVTVRDANLCTTTTNSVTVGEPTVLSATATSTPVTTIGGSDGTATAVPAGGTAPYTYLWSPGGQTTVTATGLISGSYTVIVTDSKGCTTTATTTVGSPSCNVNASASAGIIACNGGTTTLTVTLTGATAPVQYSLNGGTFQSGNTFTVDAAGSPYTVSVKDANQCTATTNTITVTQPTVLSVTATSTPVTTTGGSDGTATAVPVGGSAPYTYLWSPGGQTTITATGLTAGSYIVTVTDSKGCTTTASVTVGSAGALPLTATVVKNNMSLCSGANDGSITVTADGGTAPYTYSWTGETGSNHTPFTAGNVSSLTGLTYGYYNVTVTDATSNAVTISNIHIEIGYAVFVTSSTGASSTCVNSGTILLYGNSGVQPYTYSIDGTTFQVSNTFSGLAAGTYTGYVKDAAGCVSTKPNIIVGSASVLTISTVVKAATSCSSDGSIEIFRAGGIPGYTYSLDNITYVTNNKFLNLAPGSYTAWVKDSKGCTASQPVTVTQGAALAITASKTNSSVCVGDGTIQVNAAGGTAPYTYSLNGGTFQSANTFTGLAAAVYTVTVKDSKGCTGNLNVTIGSNPVNVTAYAGAASSCTSSNGSIQLFRTGGVGPYTYSINGNTYQGSNTFTGLTAGTYTGFVKDSRGCTGMFAGIVVGPACAAPIVSTVHNNTSIGKVSLVSSNEIKVLAYPNPSATEFILALEGFNNTKAVNIIVTDVLGKIVYQVQAIGKLQYKFGRNFIAGIYNVQVTQGDERKALKLVKE